MSCWIARVRSIRPSTRERTTYERINSQAQTLGIERPKVRNGQYVKNLNTPIYLVINAKALAKAKPINRGLLQMN